MEHILLFLLQGIFPTRGIEPASPALAGGFFTTKLPRKPRRICCKCAYSILQIRGNEQPSQGQTATLPTRPQFLPQPHHWLLPLNAGVPAPPLPPFLLSPFKILGHFTPWVKCTFFILISSPLDSSQLRSHCPHKHNRL